MSANRSGSYFPLQRLRRLCRPSDANVSEALLVCIKRRPWRLLRGLMPRRADDQDLDWVGLWGDCLARQRGLMWNKVLKKGGDNVWRMEPGI